MTRHEAQGKLDDDFLLGRISLETWRRASAELGDPTVWTASGPVEKDPRQEDAP